MPFSLVATSSTRFARAKDVIADAALILTFATVIALFSMSMPLLENFGYHYAVTGGFPWEKFHPGTIFVVLALGARILASDRPAATASRVLGADPALLLVLASVAIAAVHAVFVSASPVTGLVDTFVLPVLLLPLLHDLDRRWRRRLALSVCAIMAFNAGVALAENLTGWRLVVPFYLADLAQADPSQLDPSVALNAQAALTDWRSTALLGHPLENAIVTGALILCLASRGCRWMRPVLRFPLLVISLLAMAAFGGRTALVLTLAGLGIIGLWNAAQALAAGRLVSNRAMAATLATIPVASIIFVIGAQSGFFDRLILRFVDDQGSANARILMWDMFDPLSWTDLLLGPDPAVVQLTQHLLGLELGIESFWVALTLTYGVVVAAILFCGLGLLSWRIVATQGAGAAGVLVYYFLVASTSTSLSSKTTGLGLVTLLIILLLGARDRASADGHRQSERRFARRAAIGSEGDQQKERRRDGRERKREGSRAADADPVQHRLHAGPQLLRRR